jgi:hypothetical protein
MTQDYRDAPIGGVAAITGVRLPPIGFWDMSAPRPSARSHHRVPRFLPERAETGVGCVRVFAVHRPLVEASPSTNWTHRRANDPCGVHKPSRVSNLGRFAGESNGCTHAAIFGLRAEQVHLEAQGRARAPVEISPRRTHVAVCRPGVRAICPPCLKETSSGPRRTAQALGRQSVSQRNPCHSCHGPTPATAGAPRR